MLVLPKEKLQELHNDAKKGLHNEFNRQLEKLINDNQKHDKVWVLGKVKFPKELNGKVGRVFLQGCLEKPPMVKEAFLYEVDNRKGCKTLLWVMNPNGELRLPTLKKTVKVQSGV